MCKIHSSVLIITLIIFYILIRYFSEIVLDTETLLANSLAEQLTDNQIKEFLGFRKKWKLAGNLVMPVVIILKILLISAILDIACFFFDKEIRFNKLLRFVIQAEYIFLIPLIGKIIWFHFFQQNYTLEDLKHYYPFSVLSIVGHDDLQKWFIYPLQVLNIFELAYWLLLAYFIDRQLRVPKDKHTGLQIVVSGYGIGLLIWVVGVMFFTLNMS